MTAVNGGCWGSSAVDIKRLREQRGVPRGGTTVTYVITEPCIGTKDQSCVEVCPVDCIYDAGDQFMISPEECIDCGACEPEWPVEAIFPEDEVPDDQESCIAKAANYFE